MRSSEIRERYLRFFESRGHHILPSASLIPRDDPSILFTVAGMVPLKPFITGERKPPSPRLASCQKCFRGSGLTTDDITSVGDSTHHTFFEMLGNWSIGDYFKEGAIEFAWELMTKDFGLDPERLQPSIYPEDEDSLKLWTKKIGIPESRVNRMEDNWWQAGPTGPCGYDSEIYWDRGGKCSCGRSDCMPQDECGGDRWVEAWNLVFMEFDQHEDGSRTKLPQHTVDTGMGMERISSILQNVKSNYETDLFKDIVAGFAQRIDGSGDERRDRRSVNVLSDHVRAATFLIADGVLPANEGRGYVLRRVIRRAGIHARRIGLRGGLWKGVADVVATMGDVYPEIKERHQIVEQTLRGEEEVFSRTLESATERFDSLLSGGAREIGGKDAFRLYDTFGLPIELTVEMAAERGVTVDRAGFEAALAEQRDRSKAALTKVGFEGGVKLPETRFVGYEEMVTDADVVRIGVNEERQELHAGDEEVVFLDVSPFYAEAGGQVGDKGELTWDRDARASVLDTTYIGTARAHKIRVESGTLTAGQRVTCVVDSHHRGRTARHHSATHFLNQALREVLGGTVVQRGSYVGPDHTTFDFSFSRALTEDELRDIEARVNAHIRENLERTVAVMPLPEAKKSGAIALLDESYAENVRVIDFGGWSRELCGGTHVARTGDVGAAIIVSESSIGQGVRRIDMVVGEAAEEYWVRTEIALKNSAQLLKARPEEVPQRLTQLVEQNKELRRKMQSGGGSVAGEMLQRAEIMDVNGYKLALLDSDAVESDDVATILDRLFAERVDAQGVAAVLGKDAVAVKVGGSALEAGVNAGNVVRAAAEASGGKGGGRPEFARGGLKDPSLRSQAKAALLDKVRP